MDTTPALLGPEAHSLARNIESLPTYAGIIVKDTVHFPQVCDYRKDVLVYAKKIAGLKKEALAPVKERKQFIEAFFAPYERKIEEADNNLKLAISNFERKLKAQQEAAQRALEESLRAKAEIEAEKTAAKLLKAGNIEKAQAVLEKAQEEPIAIPQLAQIKPIADGVSFRSVFKVEVVDFALLPDQYKIPNEQLLNSIARTSKGKVAIPGCKIHEERIPIQRS